MVVHIHFYILKEEWWDFFWYYNIPPFPERSETALCTFLTLILTIQSLSYTLLQLHPRKTQFKIKKKVYTYHYFFLIFMSKEAKIFEIISKQAFLNKDTKKTVQIKSSISI